MASSHAWMDNINKKVNFSVEVSLGKIDANNSGQRRNLVTVEVKVGWKNQTRRTVGLKEVTGYRTLSIVGNVWNASRTDIISGGQNYEEIAELFPASDDVQNLVAIWERWHLNDMKAGTTQQRLALNQLDLLVNWREFSGEPLRNPIYRVVAGMKAKEQELDECERGEAQLSQLLYDIAYDAVYPFNQRYYVMEMYSLIRDVYLGRTADRYELQKKFLVTFNLNPHGDYFYGSAWLVEPVPTDVLDRLGAILHRIDTGQVNEEDTSVLPYGIKVSVRSKGAVTNRHSQWFGSNAWELRVGDETFDYYTGPAITERPDPQDILHCLFQESWYEDMTVEEVMAELCCEDQEEADDLWQRIHDNTDNLRRVLGEREFDRLREVYNA